MVWKESRGPENRPKRELADLRWRAEEREEKGGAGPEDGQKLKTAHSQLQSLRRVDRGTEPWNGCTGEMKGFGI